MSQLDKIQKKHSVCTEHSFPSSPITYELRLDFSVEDYARLEKLTLNKWDNVRFVGLTLDDVNESFQIEPEMLDPFPTFNIPLLKSKYTKSQIIIGFRNPTAVEEAEYTVKIQASSYFASIFTEPQSCVLNVNAKSSQTILARLPFNHEITEIKVQYVGKAKIESVSIDDVTLDVEHNQWIQHLNPPENFSQLVDCPKIKIEKSSTSEWSDGEKIIVQATSLNYMISNKHDQKVILMN
jgi:hypothetical protein